MAIAALVQDVPVVAIAVLDNKGKHEASPLLKHFTSTCKITCISALHIAELYARIQSPYILLVFRMILSSVHDNKASGSNDSEALLLLTLYQVELGTHIPYRVKDFTTTFDKYHYSPHNGFNKMFESGPRVYETHIQTRRFKWFMQSYIELIVVS